MARRAKDRESGVNPLAPTKLENQSASPSRRKRIDLEILGVRKGPKRRFTKLPGAILNIYRLK